MSEREWYRRVVAQPDPGGKLRILAAQARVVKSRSGALLEVIRNAVAADPEIAALPSRIQTKLLDVQRAVVEQLEERDALASGDVASATDILWTLNHPTVWRVLVRERGWSAEQYEPWLGDAFCSQLLRGARRVVRTPSSGWTTRTVDVLIPFDVVRQVSDPLPQALARGRGSSTARSRGSTPAHLAP